jgi:hypothetical protein
MATLAEMLRQGADRLVNLPSEAQRFVTNPQAFTQLLTGKNPMPRETGFAAGATGLQAQEMSVLDPNQAPYMQGYTQGEPIGYAGMAAPFAAPATVATAKALAPKAGMMAENYMVKQGMIQPLTAYHGTPHTIQGKFDINKVGTGEGNQTFGYGMYFAENPEVATQYRKMLSTPFKEKGSASQLLDMANGNYDEALKLAQKNKNIAEIHSGKAEHIDSANKTIDILNKMKNGEKLEFGNIYKVDIPDADIPMMLDWDKPLLQQTPQVQEALAKLGIKTDKQKLSQFDDALLDALMNDANKPLPKQPINPTGQDIYQTFVQGSPQLTSQKLNEAGIRGIRYLDEGSRNFRMLTPEESTSGKYVVGKWPGGGKESKQFDNLSDAQKYFNQNQTSNFVVFEPSQVKILEKNDKPVSRKELLQEQINKIE